MALNYLLNFFRFENSSNQISFKRLIDEGGIHIIVNVMSEWINMVDLSNLDSAMCNRELRPEFLNILSSQVTLFNGIDVKKKGKYYMGIRYFVWLRLRDISVKKLHNYNLSSNIMNRKNMSKLETFDLSNYKECTDSIIFQITTVCPYLTSLNISECTDLTDASLHSIAAKCENLTYLNTNGCTNFTDKGIEAICSNCRNITSFDFSKCYQVTDISLLKIAETYPKLTLLNASSCFRITDKSLSAITEKCRYINTLQLSWCLKLRDESFLSITKAYGNQLKFLLLSWSNHLTDAAADSIAKNCNNLISLDLSYCKELTSDSIVYSILQGCPKLIVFNLHGCRSITIYMRNFIAAMIDERRSQATPAAIEEAEQYVLDFTSDYR